MQIHRGGPSPPASPQEIGELRKRHLGRGLINNKRPMARRQKKWELVAVDIRDFSDEMANYSDVGLVKAEEWHTKATHNMRGGNMPAREIAITLLQT
ncbi:hypothetical protein PBY51_016975 [Eleginops maclovinus]|uniref:Uncharacterized protein n=1 Tax=Eleginops maclovinus TaxID=56733 RepID=A0AAN7WRJ7_ELEMC|nr:hypothetical protein PBY51_016975 [Eleginops maclovinus]